MTSPLTGAGFKITPVGAEIANIRGTRSTQVTRKVYGRIAGYVVDFNPPACTVGHNRLLVNGVYAAIRIGVELLRNWLANNGCKTEGVEAVKIDNTTILSTTPTFLFPHRHIEAARLGQAQFRGRSEVFCNKATKKEKTRPPAFSIPPLPPKTGDYIYTSYIRMREYCIDCYIKLYESKNSFEKPSGFGAVEFEIKDLSRRMLRIGVKLHAKWLRDNGLEKPEAWMDNSPPYEKTYLLVRSILRLDEALRTKQMRSSTVAGLSLPEFDLTLLRYHLGRNRAREHPLLMELASEKASKRFSTSRARILEKTQIDIDLSYDQHLKELFPDLCKQLEFPGEYVPPSHMAEFVFSRVSVPIAVQTLRELTAGALEDNRRQEVEGRSHA